jgi:hypothetical protein
MINSATRSVTILMGSINLWLSEIDSRAPNVGTTLSCTVLRNIQQILTRQMPFKFGVLFGLTNLDNGRNLMSPFDLIMNICQIYYENVVSMERGKLDDISFVFRIWVFEMIFGKITTMRNASRFKQGENVVNYGDFMCVNCILCVDTLGNLNCK